MKRSLRMVLSLALVLLFAFGTVAMATPAAFKGNIVEFKLTPEFERYLRNEGLRVTADSAATNPYVVFAMDRWATIGGKQVEMIGAGSYRQAAATTAVSGTYTLANNAKVGANAGDQGVACFLIDQDKAATGHIELSGNKFVAYSYPLPVDYTDIWEDGKKYKVQSYVPVAAIKDGEKVIVLACGNVKSVGKYYLIAYSGKLSYISSGSVTIDSDPSGIIIY